MSGPGQAGEDHRSRHPHHDHDPVAQHLFPDLVGCSRRTPLKGYSLQFLEQGRDVFPAIKDQRMGRFGKYLVFAHLAS